MHKVLALLDAGLEFGDGSLHQLLLVLVQLAQAQVLRHAVFLFGAKGGKEKNKMSALFIEIYATMVNTYAKNQRGGEVGGLGHIGLDERTFHNFLAVECLHQLQNWTKQVSYKQ